MSTMPPTGVSGPAPKSGAVTTIGVLNFVLGGLSLVCGGVILMGGAAFMGMGSSALQQGGADPQQAGAAAAALGGLVMVIAVVVLILGVPMIIAGVGITKRANWGRILTLILGGIAGVLAVINLATFNIVGVIIDGGYCALVFAILLQQKYAAEFS